MQHNFSQYVTETQARAYLFDLCNEVATLYGAVPLENIESIHELEYLNEQFCRWGEAALYIWEEATAVDIADALNGAVSILGEFIPAERIQADFVKAGYIAPQKRGMIARLLGRQAVA